MSNVPPRSPAQRKSWREFYCPRAIREGNRAGRILWRLGFSYQLCKYIGSFRKETR